MSQVERVSVLRANAINLEKQYIAYWCHKALRTKYNHALEYAIHLANKHTLPLVVFTTSDTTTSNCSLRHLMFDLQAKQNLATNLAANEILCLHLFGHPLSIATYIAQEASALIIDKPYLNEDQEIVNKLIEWSQSTTIQVESNLVVPLDSASTKLEYAAYTLRPKLNALTDKFLVPITHLSLETPSLHFAHPHLMFPASFYPPQFKYQHIQSADNNTICTQQFIHKTFSSIDSSIKTVSMYGGEDAAQDALSDFLEHRLLHYDAFNKDPSNNDCKGYTSHLSSFLRVGSISPIDIILQTRAYIEFINSTLDDEKLSLLHESYNTFFEELVVRRELAHNFVFHNNRYDQYSAIPSWAETTLANHLDDSRPILYSNDRMEHASTDDVYWNAAQNQLRSTGAMHGYMRMYWGKKILEWCETPKQAFEFTLALNNKYALDAPDPNGYAGISWCYGTHDRPHPERQIFGKIRYMNATGLVRKFNIKAYAEHWT